MVYTSSYGCLYHPFVLLSENQEQTSHSKCWSNQLLKLRMLDDNIVSDLKAHVCWTLWLCDILSNYHFESFDRGTHESNAQPHQPDIFAACTHVPGNFESCWRFAGDPHAPVWFGVLFEKRNGADPSFKWSWADWTNLDAVFFCFTSILSKTPTGPRKMTFLIFPTYDSRDIYTYMLAEHNFPSSLCLW